MLSSGHNERFKYNTVLPALFIGGGTRGAKGATAPPDSKIYAFGPPPPDFHTRNYPLLSGNHFKACIKVSHDCAIIYLHEIFSQGIFKL